MLNIRTKACGTREIKKHTQLIIELIDGHISLFVISYKRVNEYVIYPNPPLLKYYSYPRLA